MAATAPPGGHSPEYQAVLEYLYGCARRLAPLMAPESTPAHMRRLLRAAMDEIADELERAGFV